MPQTKIEIIEGIEHFLNRYDQNNSDLDLINWTAKSLFFYLNEYFILSKIELERLDSLRDKNGCLNFSEESFKKMAAMTYRIFVNARVYELDNQFERLCERSLVVFLSHFLCPSDLEDSISNNYR